MSRLLDRSAYQTRVSSTYKVWFRMPLGMEKAMRSYISKECIAGTRLTKDGNEFIVQCHEDDYNELYGLCASMRRVESNYHSYDELDAMMIKLGIRNF